ncbi:hypothetical protein EOD39_13501 [Acipenser ruthenus]|uniref:Uncharacterized protein n=1 Tax=Acipenser ruthenus TaxID=7906 RepID=A0A662YNL2_ACIRT|nr:hypothetical protein EOD39_13500 [Acipenser ruthenus]RXM98157.1 hypothetical protein EOD39_13501 [Acipenser ruthenus]
MLGREVGEKLDVLAADIECLARRAFEDAPPEFTEWLVLDLFIRGLSPNELLRHIQLAHPRSIIQALEKAEEMDEARARHRRGTKVFSARDLTRSDESNGEQEEQLVCASQATESTPPRKPPACRQCCSPFSGSR